MSEQEAKTIVQIMLSADSGCPRCGADLLRRFVASFPDQQQLARRLYSEEWGFELAVLDA